VPVDTLQCQSCGVTVTEEDWMAPLMPLLPGRCMNCGDRRDFQNCVNCGLTRDEDVQVHDELRFMVSPNHNLFEAARLSSRAGRRLIGLKLATAAVVTNEGGSAEAARSLRIWLLAAVGEPESALEDAKAWVDNTPDPSALAWATYGQQLQAEGSGGAAADAYYKSLKQNAAQYTIRARRAQILFELNREGQALDETCRILASTQADEQATSIALAVAEHLADLFEGQFRDDEITRMLDLIGDEKVKKSPTILAHRARLAAQEGDTASAKRDLKMARKINPELDIYERVERALKPARSSWWRW
jgi:tetratricopeptide (TPR) repeat protein